MKQQTAVLRQEMTAQYGPSISVSWTNEDDLVADCYRIFPMSDADIEAIPDQNRGRKVIFRGVSEWWTRPSPNSFPKKYVVLGIRNSQANTARGSARNVQIALEMSVKKITAGHPPIYLHTVDFEVPIIKAGETAKIPIRVEGIPEFSFEIKSLKYFSENEREEISSWSGNSTYYFPQ